MIIGEVIHIKCKQTNTWLWQKPHVLISKTTIRKVMRIIPIVNSGCQSQLLSASNTPPITKSNLQIVQFPVKKRVILPTSSIK